MNLLKGLSDALSGYKTLIGFGLGVALLACGWFGFDLTPNDPATLVPVWAWDIVGLVIGVGVIAKLKKIENAANEK